MTWDQLQIYKFKSYHLVFTGSVYYMLCVFMELWFIGFDLFISKVRDSIFHY